ncbi:Ger(x)C family spore germination protein [Paenibacillus sp. FSL M8-0334]|uniref:Ger(X)C family spore germination protein n=1 Tax=Paenibacillus campinasensis TaxID=66347 RepID=A0ABW9SWY4_9BACL|nr:Ger(x)C family spore germination protein [Paenibacillus campinasensis]MUG65520.1 Ger(x)C family spore germination protein [Paenibacillus campinasensis]
MKVWKIYVKLQLAIFLLLLLAGCWDHREITFSKYATSIGIDYKEDEYILYAQMLNFGNIGKLEGQSLEKKPIVIGTARGKTLTDAVFMLYRSEQFPVFWGHVTSVVFTKEALQRVNFLELSDSLSRYYAIRYNVWAYGTESSIEELFNLSPFFGMSPFESILMSPLDTYRQYSDIRPIYMFRFIANYLEPGRTAGLPQLTTNRTTWMEGGKESTQMMLGGEYFFHESQYKGKLGYEEGCGKRYLDKKMNRVPLTIYQGQEPVMTLVLHVQDYKVNHTVKNGNVIYDLKLTVKGLIDEMGENVTHSFIKNEIIKKMKKEIQSTFDKGLEISADVYNLNDTVYRYDHKTWQTYLKGKPPETTMQLGKIDIDVVIINSGKYKNRKNE